VNATEHNIMGSLTAKAWAIRLAAEAAISVLGVDGIIMCRGAWTQNSPTSRKLG
jgi:T-complex protein 1 subunit theta